MNDARNDHQESPPSATPDEATPLRTAGIELRNLTVRVPGETLLHHAEAVFPEGKVTLVAGPSGSGKSVLLGILAGLTTRGHPAIEVEGDVFVGGRDVLAAGAIGRQPSVGVVFQSFALLDELSTLDNIRFAHDHRRVRRGAKKTNGPSPQELLDEFDIPRATPVSALSGGQKQRLALARTLAHDPPVILYDEPTTGLDPVNARRVARRIRETGQAHAKTSIVVTHDYGSLAPIADVVYVLDPRERHLIRIDKSELARVADELSPPPRATPKRTSTARRAGASTLRWFEATTLAIERALLCLLFLLPRWRSARWGLRYLRHYLGLLASPASCLYFAAAGTIAGFVSTHFVFEFLPHRQYTEPLLTDELLRSLGFAQYRILIPVLLTVLLAARCAAAVSADVGNRVYTRQTDAMRTLGAPPGRYLLTNVLWAFLLATPLLVGIGFLSAKYTSLAVFVYDYPEHGPYYWDSHFHLDLRLPTAVFFRGSGWLLAKLLACGFGVGGVAYWIGARPKTSGTDVSRDVTRSIIAATLWVLAVHFGFAFLEF